MPMHSFQTLLEEPGTIIYKLMSYAKTLSRWKPSIVGSVELQLKQAGYPCEQARYGMVSPLWHDIAE